MKTIAIYMTVSDEVADGLIGDLSDIVDDVYERDQVADLRLGHGERGRLPDRHEVRVDAFSVEDA